MDMKTFSLKSILIVLLLAVGSVGHGNAQTTAAEHADIAFEIWDKDDPGSDELLRAIDLMTKAAELEPDEYKWQYNLGVFYYGISNWENAKTFFGKAIPLAKNDEDKTDAKNWLTKSRDKLHKSRIESSREGSMLVENRERDFTRFHMKEYKLMEERPVMRDRPILPQTTTGDSPRKLIQYFRNTVPSFNAVQEDVFIIVGPYSNQKLKAHYRRGIHDFYNFFRREYFPNPPKRYISVMISENPDELIDAAKRIYTNIRLRVYAPFVGFHVPADNLIVATIGGGYGTLLHEMMHALIQDDNTKTPRWLEESMASLYERSMWRNQRLMPLPNWRMSFFSGSVIPLSTLDGVVKNPRIGPRELANLRLLLLFIDQEKMVPALYRAVQNSRQGFSLKQTVLGLSSNFTESNWGAFGRRIAYEYALELRLADERPSYAEVKILQQALNKIMDANLDVDGHWGPKTETALKAFQSKYGLKVTGEFNPQTRERIEQEYRSVAVKR
jgi:hypothetical protein